MQQNTLLFAFFNYLDYNITTIYFWGSYEKNSYTTGFRVFLF